MAFREGILGRRDSGSWGRKTVFLAVSLLIVGGISVRAQNVPPTQKPLPAVIHIELSLTRTESGGTAEQAAPTDGKPISLALPLVSTLDGNTATASLTGSDLSYNVALSPTLESSNNKANSTNSVSSTNSTAAAPSPSAKVLWNLRLAGKSLPGATTCAISGASRLEIGKDAGITEMTLTDPKTGRTAAFKLGAKMTLRPPGSGTSSTP
jgi:hypothetical protein